MTVRISSLPRTRHSRESGSHPVIDTQMDARGRGHDEERLDARGRGHDEERLDAAFPAFAGMTAGMTVI